MSWARERSTPSEDLSRAEWHDMFFSFGNVSKRVGDDPAAEYEAGAVYYEEVSHLDISKAINCVHW